MAVSTCDLIKFAESTKLSEDEAARRASVSRAYYCAFHDLAHALHPMFKPEDRRQNGLPSHAAVASALRDVGSRFPDRKKAMAYGVEARAMWNVYHAVLRSRGYADYGLNTTNEMAPREVVVHLGRVVRLRKFAAKLAA